MTHSTLETRTFVGPADDAEEWVYTTLEKGFDLYDYTPTSDLTNRISGLFTFRKWVGIDQQTYKKMEPGLRLASRMVNDERLLDWFYHLISGRVRTHGKDKYFARRAGFDFYNNQADREGVQRQWRQKIEQIKSKHRWHFVDVPDPFHDFDAVTFQYPGEFEGYRAYDFNFTQAAIDDPDFERDLYVKRNERSVSSTVFADSFRRYLLHIPDDVNSLDAVDKQQWMNFQFMLACVLVHELAHVVQHHPYVQLYTIKNRRNPLEVHHSLHELQTGEQPEAGNSWERYMFGDPVGPANFTGLRCAALTEYQKQQFQGNEFQVLSIAITRQTPSTNGTYNGIAHSFGPHCYVERILPPQWIEKWFRTATWDQADWSENRFPPCHMKVKIWPPLNQKREKRSFSRNALSNTIIKVEARIDKTARSRRRKKRKAQHYSRLQF